MNTLFLSSFFLSSLQCVVCLNRTFQQPLSPVTHLLCSLTRLFWIDTGGFSSVHFSSVTQSCLTLCNPMDCSMPGLPAHHQLSELAQTRPLHWWCHPTILSSVVPFSSCFQSFPASGSFQMSKFFPSGGQSIGISASASVLPMNIQG